MKKMIANFYPAQEEKNGHIGVASLTIGNAVRINGISVFQKEDGVNLSFPGFGENGSYVVPHSKEAFAAMCEVVEMAVKSEKHFGYNRGDYGVRLNVKGDLVSEPYADGRFSVDVSDVCTLYGITTRVQNYEKDGKDRSFVAVDTPNSGSYTDRNGEVRYRPAFEGLVSAWKDKDGVDQSINYGDLMRGLILGERKAMLKDRKPTLDSQVQNAQNRAQETENQLSVHK